MKNFFRKLFENLGRWIIRKTCSHSEKKVTFICYQDRYVEYYCDNCEQEIFEDLDQ